MSSVERHVHDWCGARDQQPIDRWVALDAGPTFDLLQVLRSSTLSHSACASRSRFQLSPSSTAKGARSVPSMWTCLWYHTVHGIPWKGVCSILCSFEQLAVQHERTICGNVSECGPEVSVGPDRKTVSRWQILMRQSSAPSDVSSSRFSSSFRLPQQNDDATNTPNLEFWLIWQSFKPHLTA